MGFEHIDRALGMRINDSSREDSNRFYLSIKNHVKQLVDKGNLADPESARRAILQLLEFYKEKDEFDLQQAKLKRELIQQELLLSVTSTESMYSILKATAPLNAQGEPEITPEYEQKMAAMIADSLRSEASSMPLASLQKWSGIFTANHAINTLVTDRQNKEAVVRAKLGKLPGDLTGDELDKLADEGSSQAWSNKAVSFNAIKIPDINRLDFADIGGDIRSITKDLKDILSKKYNQHNFNLNA